MLVSYYYTVTGSVASVPGHLCSGMIHMGVAWCVVCSSVKTLDIGECQDTLRMLSTVILVQMILEMKSES